MTASLNQDFVTYTGDDIKPIFTVRNQAGAVVNIATVSEITWRLKQQNGTVVFTKLKSTGAVTFTTDGSNGQFQVTILAADTAPLSGYYQYDAAIKDASGQQTTTSIGRMQVGPKPTWTYDATKLATNTVYQVRRLIGDVMYGDQQLQDEEIAWYISTYSTVWAAGAAAARGIAANYTRMVDTVQGELRTLYTQRTKNYALLADQLAAQAKARGPAFVYAGGISVADKQMQIENTDRVPPQFFLLIFDNFLPVAPIGHQSPISPAPVGVP